MNDILFGILQIAATAAILVVIRYLLPLMVQGLRSHNYNFAADIVEHIVRSVEQMITGAGPEKLEKATQAVTEALARYHITLTEDQIRELIESAVQTMNAELGAHTEGNHE